ncbi:ferredoxin [Dactylosporangium matsuzakiense]|uniref:Ferredoxin n=1 Tax=Dactylosporangium matsuzakiense TaxID=53360 RepID=A0A9W6KT46_9ACTN|nr:ferredoxin [Dactylosporangium matsuzakiense]UWZ41665.1 ferredoxin [Dactylosporangium matsuzakiense]GLL06712.1 ferredoxin [Dactylosporangium matsuzakiense]
MKVRADTAVCVASGMCVMHAPEVFDQREDDAVVVVLVAEPPEREHDAVRQAVLGCPSGALSID